MLSEPESYGMSAAETLAHRCATPTPDDFDAYWQAVRGEVAALPHGVVDLNDAGPFRYRSVREVNIEGCVIPHTSDVMRGAVLELHVAETQPQVSSDPPAWATDGIATVRIHVRGFPPSVDGCSETGQRWLCCNAGAAQAWIVRHAVADVMQAYRIMRGSVDASLPCMMIGPSLGGGLAVIAAAQVNSMNERGPDRLVLDLPSLGDWRWRVEHYCNGLGGPLSQLVDAMRGPDREVMIDSFAYCDAALHAPAVTCPVLCHLAQLDDVVPAPSAAAICNALGSRQIETVITRYGHFEGGIRHAREIAAFRQLVPRFLASATGPDKGSL